MGMFGRKPIYKCKILEKYKTTQSELSRCEKIGETPLFNIYNYRDGSSTYLLRQEKANHNKVVYLGQAKRNMCIYNDKIFAIDRINYNSRTYHPLYCTDILTGKISEFEVLSDKGCYIAMHWHCQDCVELMTLDDDTIILDVTRYKESSHYEEELKYRVYLRDNGGTLVKEYN